MSIKYYFTKMIKKIRGVTVKNSYIDKTSKIESGTQFINSTIGRHSFCGYDCDILNTKIGSFCSIANCVVIGGGEHPMEWVSTSPVFYEGRDSVNTKFSEHVRPVPKDVLIGHDVWVGRNVLIKQGVVIGTGAVIGMGSIVTKDVSPYSIVAGSPATLIRMRFEKNVVEQLLESEWWNFSDKKLNKYACFFDQPKKAIDAFKL